MARACPYERCHHNHEGEAVTEANSPQFDQGQRDHEVRNEARQACPPRDLWTYCPRDLNYPVMYDKGWNSVEDVPIHSCKTCREGGAGS